MKRNQRVFVKVGKSEYSGCYGTVTYVYKDGRVNVALDYPGPKMCKFKPSEFKKDK